MRESIRMFYFTFFNSEAVNYESLKDGNFFTKHRASIPKEATTAAGTAAATYDTARPAQPLTNEELTRRVEELYYAIESNQLYENVKLKEEEIYYALEKSRAAANNTYTSPVAAAANPSYQTLTIKQTAPDDYEKPSVAPKTHQRRGDRKKAGRRRRIRKKRRGVGPNTESNASSTVPQSLRQHDQE